MYPDFDRRDVVGIQIARVREMLAVSTLNYSEVAMPPQRTSLRNTFLANSAQIPNGTLNVNETIRLAETSARDLRVLLGAARPAGAHR
jgi:hypothetical protein